MSEIYATVNGVNITDADVDDFLQKLPNEQRVYLSDPNFRKHCTEQLIEREMFYAYGETEKLYETEEFKETLAKTRKDMLSRFAVHQVLSAAQVTEEEMKEYYEQHKDKFVKDQLATAKHILVADEAQCNQIKDDIASGSISFEDAAKEHSTCPSGKNGGDLGTFGKGQMVPEFDEVVFSADLKTVVGPVKTQFGYHLIFIENRTDNSPATYDEVKEQLEHSLLNEKQDALYTAKVAELKKRFCS